MKLEFNKVKEFFSNFDYENAKEKAKEITMKYYKVAGSVAVVTSLCAICTVTLIGKVIDKNASSGVMMTLSDVAAKEVAFAGETFEVAGVAYDNMLNVTYEANQLAQLEKSEKQVEEILLSNAQDKRDRAVLGELTANQAGVSVDTPSAPSVPAVSPSVAPTYTDANGTYEYAGEFTITAYCACSICCGRWSNVANPTTASGTTATAGRTIAADTSVFPFGTRLAINGQIYTVEDTGGAIKGNRIDIFFSSHAEALNFGRQAASVYRVVE